MTRKRRARLPSNQRERPRALTENIEWNRRQRDTWSQEVERIRLENAARRTATRLRIQSGRPSVAVLP